MEKHQHDREHLVKRVMLPSGKTIEVVYFGEHARTEALRHPVLEPARDLHVCLECSSKLAYPTTWEEADSNHWSVTIRCPECEIMREGVFDQEAVEAFDEELDAGTDALMADYRRLMRSNMAEEMDRFAAALSADAVLPEDF
jgi:DNA-directed RNA polymerase subunit RPC12/RpoP